MCSQLVTRCSVVALNMAAMQYRKSQFRHRRLGPGGFGELILESLTMAPEDSMVLDCVSSPAVLESLIHNKIHRTKSY